MSAPAPSPAELLVLAREACELTKPRTPDFRPTAEECMKWGNAVIAFREAATPAVVAALCVRLRAQCVRLGEEPFNEPMTAPLEVREG